MYYTLESYDNCFINGRDIQLFDLWKKKIIDQNKIYKFQNLLFGNSKTNKTSYRIFKIRIHKIMFLSRKVKKVSI